MNASEQHLVFEEMDLGRSVRWESLHLMLTNGLET